MTTPRLDILIYAHDGRGLGHASRSIAIGMALRRLYPELRVLFVSGSRHSQELIGACPLDWLKLPSYETEVVAGKSRGVAGRSNFSDKELGVVRTRSLEQTVLLYRPRLVLVDHQPQGKHRELLAAQAAGKIFETEWLLGVRGVVGAVPQLASELAEKTFSDSFSGLLWYGDSSILGDEHKDGLARAFGVDPVECGYVARIKEERYWRQTEIRGQGQEPLAGTVAIPWQDEAGVDFMGKLASALRQIGKDSGQWHLYVGGKSNTTNDGQLYSLLGDLENCRLFNPGPGYVNSLESSGVAVICGGYNSLTDVVGMGIPALVVIRDIKDREQQIHVDCLRESVGAGMQAIEPGNITTGRLTEIMRTLMEQERYTAGHINFAGAENAAKQLAGRLGVCAVKA